jgi:peptidoglycan-associated lipoprotein
MRVIEKDNYSIINPVVSSDASVKIKLEGNTDEFGSDEYNVALGLKRARAVKNTLIGYGIPANKISLVSLGEGNPICGAKTESCYKKNRRVDHKLLK